ncbi:MAG: hypothetical protein CMP11_03910 [Zetaproteobacteria bacterium]|nr:hypothetical protein [Pseudobdellovibrionaceae bacterium]
MLQKYIFVTYFIILSIHSTRADTSNTALDKSTSLKITILEKGSGRKLKRVEVSLGEDIFYSDKQGEVLLDRNKIKGAIKFYRAGYNSLSIEEKDYQDTEKINIFLYPSQPGGNLVTIFGEGSTEVSKKEISIEEAIEVAPRGDPVQIIKLLPGVQSNTFGPRVIVRGSEPSDSKYLIDNFDLPFVYHGVGGISVIPPKIIDEVDFSTGGFSSRYGEATGGIISIQTKKNIPDKASIDARINLPLYSSVFYEAPLNKNSAFSVSYRRSYIDFFVRRFLDEQKFLVIPTFTDAHLQYLYKKDSTSLKATTVYSRDTLELAFPGDGADEDGKIEFDIATEFFVSGLDVEKKISTDWKMRASPHIINTSVFNNFQNNYVKIWGPSFRTPFTFQKRLSRSEKIKFGLDFQYDYVKVDIKVPRIRRDSAFQDFEEGSLEKVQTTYEEQEYAVWSQIDHKIGSLILTPGLRAYYFSKIDSFGIDPRFTVVWGFSKSTEFKASVGKFSKSPSPQEIDPTFGNPNLNFENSYHYIGGWYEKWSQFWQSEVQLYFKSNKNVISSDKEVRYNNSSLLQSYGFEFFLRRLNVDRLFGWISYTLSKTEIKRGNSSWVPTRFDQTHVLNFVSFYRITGQWGLGFRLNYRTGERYTPIDYAVYNANLAKYQPRYKSEDENSKHLPDYNQIDFYTTYDFLFDNWKLNCRLGVEFISFTKPAYGIKYNYDYSKADFLTGLPPIPYIEIRGEL